MNCGLKREESAQAAENQACPAIRSSGEERHISRARGLLAHDTDRRGDVRRRQRFLPMISAEFAPAEFNSK